MSRHIKLTPLGQGAGVCSLLQIGDGFNILLDCGLSTSSLADIEVIERKVREVGGCIDCVLLSHADFHHVGALPFILGCSNLLDVPVICTSPALKMAQMALYDAQINSTMIETPGNVRTFSLDDIDHCFRNVINLKYNQVHCRDHSDGRDGEVFVCAYPAGRTLGGASWSIRCGSTEVVYLMDINLRRETLLEGGSLDLPPSSPALLVVGGAVSEKASSAGGSGYRRKKDRGDDGLVSSIMDTVRSEGNVLVPCESVGRTLELLLLLNKYWTDNNLGMYHLVYLSPMSCNTVEFARCQLEWMSDTLCHDFYMGRPNPFALASVKILTSLRELDMLGPGPRVVLATDSSLSGGFSRQLLMRWGGDPRSRVVFTDISESGTLAAELRAQAPPVIATIVRSERVPLAGEELEEFQKAEATRRRHLDAASQRRRREKELTDVCV
jgi:Cft2 family RNA processing exonuclease